MIRYLGLLAASVLTTIVIIVVANFVEGFAEGLGYPITIRKEHVIGAAVGLWFGTTFLNEERQG